MKELKVSLGGMPINDLISEVNRKDFTQKALEGLKVKSKQLSVIELDPMWDEAFEGFIPKSKAKRKQRMESKKELDHKIYLDRMTRSSHAHAMSEDGTSWRASFSQHRKELEPLYRFELKEIDKPFPESRQKSGKQVLMDYYEYVEEERYECVSNALKLTDTRGAIKIAKQIADEMESNEAFYRTKAEEIRADIQRMQELEAELMAELGYTI